MKRRLLFLTLAALAGAGANQREDRSWREQ